MPDHPLFSDVDVLLSWRSHWPAPDLVVVSVHGEIDLSTAARLRFALTEHLDLLPRVVVADLVPVRFLGVAGLNVFTEVRTVAAERGAQLRIVTGGRRPLQRPIELCGLCDVLPVYRTVEDALGR
ncbi:STAS domain-containing protein [Prauserella cavernicola]|uniref:STAS domain-containing protein n=1 Tax=Prauserella cavernicola TaxID=2800127 RepID=A0A934QND1_9PSEU|nr:STAS domain-containing protein [Prauserella cavernicola]MBK1782988.1 STAS domain-containing protein [Prauserella cavernicola]